MSANVNCDVRVPVRGYVHMLISAPTPEDALNLVRVLIQNHPEKVLNDVRKLIRQDNFHHIEFIEEGDQFVANISVLDCTPDY